MKVLLLANIGSGSAGFYHAGDEAMFYQTYKWYRREFTHTSLGVFSLPRVRSLPALKIHTPLPWPSHDTAALIYFFKLVLKVLVYKIARISLFTETQYACISVIQQYDRLHFTGGGNLTSEFKSWLYYAYFLIFTAWILGKEVILSSQSIGPFTLFDTVISTIILNLSKEIGLREIITNKYPLSKYGIFLPRIHSDVDAATHISANTRYALSNQPTYFRIGLSLHDWKSYGSHIEQATLNVIKAIHSKQPVELVLIPHVFTTDMRQFDMRFMLQLIKRVSKNINVIIPSYEELTQSATEPASTIKTLTSSVDVLISTRYHGLVFALATNTPVVGFHLDAYYNHKNKKLLEFYKNHDCSCWFINLN
jgi:polysaccharide pyruvyl transferase WcaK-like protein